VGDEPARTSTRERYAMNEDNSIIHLRQPDEIDDPLTALLRSGARRLLEQGHCHVFIGQGATVKLMCLYRAPRCSFAVSRLPMGTYYDTGDSHLTVM
jgi:hypothetical protein